MAKPIKAVEIFDDSAVQLSMEPIDTFGYPVCIHPDELRYRFSARSSHKYVAEVLYARANDTGVMFLVKANHPGRTLITMYDKITKKKYQRTVVVLPAPPATMAIEWSGGHPVIQGKGMMR